MDKQIKINADILGKVPDLFVLTKVVQNISVKENSDELKERRVAIIDKWMKKTRNDLTPIKEIAAYRNLQQKLGLNPNKVLPAVEGLFERGIFKAMFPRINSAVDAANVVSAENMIPIGAFDLDKIKGEIELKLAGQNDEYVPIGKNNPEKIQSGTPILQDAKRIFSAIGTRDSEETKVSVSSKNLLILSWGTQEIEKEKVAETLEKCGALIKSLSK